MLPWAEMWRAALKAGIGPNVFWSLSVREWLWLSGNRIELLDQTRLKDLMELYPDG